MENYFSNKSNCFIIAELSANHGGDIEIAKETVRAAKRAGADAIKLQTYTADTITLNVKSDDFKISQGTRWDGQYLYDLYMEASLPWEWHKDLFELSKEEGLICFSSPFDKTAVDFLEDLNTPIYKIASFEITDTPLIEYIASKKKPIIISTGVANYEDIELAIQTCRNLGNNDITILKCTSSYPAPIKEANLIMMQQYAKDFNVKVGLSDHTLGNTLPIAAAVLGASVIEKHFILDKAIGGPDAEFSLDENEFTEMVNAVRQAEKAIGKIDYRLSNKQHSAKIFSRSLYVVQDVKEGDVINNENLRSIRPGFGLHPKYLKELIGKKFSKTVFKGERLSLDLIDLES